MSKYRRMRNMINFQSKDFVKHCLQLTAMVSGVFKGNLVPAYWCIANNFGDSITPLLLRHYGFTPIHFYPFRIYPKKTLLVSTGSILEFVPDSYSGIILGSGFMHSSTKKKFKNAKIIGVRGRLTRNMLECGEEVILGDPGILASFIIKKRMNKKWVLGIVPHYMDMNNAIIDSWRQKLGNLVKIIDVRQKPSAVFAEIDSCENIISSSLHGLIVADSFKIPNAWFKLAKLGGGEFKFYDYYSTLGITPEPINDISGNETLKELLLLIKPKDEAILKINEKLKETLDNAFKQLKIISNTR